MLYRGGGRTKLLVMNIAALITKQYLTVDAYVEACNARILLQIQDAVVVMDGDRAIGILTAMDVALKPEGLVVECFRYRPPVDFTDTLSTVLDRMVASGDTTLPVNRQGSFYGLIKQSTILAHLYANQEKQKLALLAAAHDIRCPIAAIETLGTILKADPALSHHQHLIGKLNETCDYIQMLIEDILTTEQCQDEAIELADERLDELVDTCTESLADKFEGKQLVLSKHLVSNTVIKVDRPKLTRAISNILWNSIKFTHPGGVIDVFTEEVPGWAMLVVQDTGIGVPKSMQEHIFDKFTEAKRKGTAGEPTTGLGLYLTKTVVESHGGTISMESDGQSGSRFTISLPC